MGIRRGWPPLLRRLSQRRHWQQREQLSAQPQARERVERIRSVFLEALATDPGARTPVLDRHCATDPELRLEVERLLAARSDADEFLTDLARRSRAPFATFGPKPAPEPAPEGRRLGAYRLIRELGRGGMGAVYLAERADERYDKQVAIKLLPLGLGSPASRERFLAERRMLAQLEHPGIARLVDAGVAEDGTPYFIMEYVQGEPITDYCDRVAFGIEERLALFLQVCDAVEYTHRNRVVHRDLKPANILVTPDGRAKLLDFGIAKVLNGDLASASTLTQWGGSPLTPSFASPEQVSGEAIGFTSDVYQLGLLLYHLLTGYAPYSISSRHTPAEARRVIMEQMPEPPSRAGDRAAVAGGEPTVAAREIARLRDTEPASLRNRLRGDLDNVVLKALSKEPERRYGSVAAFAEDVARHMDGARVLARRESRVRRAGRIRFRSSRFAGLAAAAVLALVAALGFSQANRSATADWPGQPGIGASSTGSLVAHRFYQEGLRAYYRGEPSIAYPLFSAAAREDSTFAMARYYLGRSSPNWREGYAHIDLARDLAQHGNERERLLISAEWAEMMSDPSLRAIAETLAVRYPALVDGHYLLGAAHVRGGDFLAALPHFERVVAMDSASFGESGGLCRGCDALEKMVNAYIGADSLPAAERTARNWIRLQPGSATAWQQLAWTLWRQERGEEAIAARMEATQRRAATAQDQIYPAVVGIRMGDYAGADALLTERIRNGTPAVQREARWWQTVSFRYQGRLREALGSATHFRELVEAGVEDPPAWERVALQAQVLFEMGRFRESADLIEFAAAERYSGLSTRRDARHRVWVLTHATAAAMALGDTARVRVLADTIEALGGGSGYASVSRLHHYPRGLLLTHSGNRDGAVTAFRNAIVANSFGRPKLELARLLIEMRQPEAAVPVLQAALRGPIAGAGFHVTRPELHELLGRAWDATGRPDSAMVNYRKAIAAWEHADPELRQRRVETQRRLVALMQ